MANATYETAGERRLRRIVLGFGLFMLFGGALYLGLDQFGYTVEFGHTFKLPSWLMISIGVAACVIGVAALALARALRPHRASRTV